MGLAGTDPFKWEPQSVADRWRVVAGMTGLIDLLPWGQRAADRYEPAPDED